MTEESPSTTLSAEYFPLVENHDEDIILSPVPYHDGSEHHLHLADVDEEVNEESYTSPSLIRRRQPARLNGLNYLNVVTYGAHLFVSWGIGVKGLDGLLETRWQITTRYETLVTPAKWAYYLWAPILVLEGIFAIAQLFPYYRARPIIQEGTGYYFFYTFLIQTIWTFFFSFRLFILSFISVLAALLSLVSLLVSQQKAAIGGRTNLIEYVLFGFPFYLHTGWMVFMTVDHFSILFRAYGAGIGLQVAADIVSLAVMLPVAALCLVTSWRDFCIPTVILYAYVSIGCRLLHPSKLLLDLYGHVIVEAIRDAAYFCAGIVVCLIVPNLVVWFSREFCTINVVELDG